jgi:hypothetical protein
MKDDEYTRTVLALDVRAAQNNVAQQKLPAILRSLQRPDARGFADYLAGQSNPTMVLGPNGLPMGTSIQVDRHRVNRTGLRILKGLYFVETRKPIPKNAEVRLECKAGLTAEHPDMLKIAPVFHLLPDRRDGALGRAFSYAAGFGFGRSVWMMLLYDYHFWLGSVDERDVSEREATPPEDASIDSTATE